MNDITQYVTGWGKYYLEILIAITIGLGIMLWYLLKYGYEEGDNELLK